MLFYPVIVDGHEKVMKRASDVESNLQSLHHRWYWCHCCWLCRHPRGVLDFLVVSAVVTPHCCGNPDGRVLHLEKILHSTVDELLAFRLGFLLCGLGFVWFRRMQVPEDLKWMTPVGFFLPKAHSLVVEMLGLR